MVPFHGLLFIQVFLASFHATTSVDLGVLCRDTEGSFASHLLQRTSRTVRSASTLDFILQGNRPVGLCSNLPIPELPAVAAVPLRNIQWLHFPKAGTSFISTIWNYACTKRAPLDLAVSPRASPGCERCYDFALMDRYPADEYCEEGYLSRNFSTQHDPMTASTAKLEKWQVIGMFRRPSQRLISAFHDSCHASGMAKDQAASLLKECGKQGQDSAACYARFPGIAGCMSRMLTGGFCAETQGNQSNFDGGKARLPDALAMVKEMAFVGLTEYWDLSICLFQRMFGGTVNIAQLVDFHEGASHVDELYDESQLLGFVDEVDEAIYRAAHERFSELLQTYVSPDFSECKAMVQGGNRLTETDSMKVCSCEGAGRECGFSSTLGISCGRCPAKRIGFIGASDGTKVNATVTCDEVNGHCMVEGLEDLEDAQRLMVFKWTI